MESQATLRAWRRMKGRRPKTIEDTRFCTTHDCATKLSRYNHGPFCYNHSPVSFPRNRGVVSEV